MSEFGGGERPAVRACRDCGQIKPLDEFHVSPKRKYGRGSYCQPCFNERSKRSYAKRVMAKQGREVRVVLEIPAGQRHCPDCDSIQPLENFPRNKSGRHGYGSYCKPCHNARTNSTKQKLYGGNREYHLRQRYGITQQDFDAILAIQGRVCAICDAPNPEHVDHDHESGKVRGILCFNCNGGLGQFKDDVATMRRAITYLKETKCQAVLVQPGVYRLPLRRRASRLSLSS